MAGIRIFDRADLPFIDLENLHAEHRHGPADECHDHDPNQHRDVPSRDAREDLTSDNAVDHAISEICDEIQEAADPAGVITHEVAGHDLSIFISTRS